MATISINAPAASGFLYSNPRTARLCISAETPEFDNVLIRDWQNEGFDVVYVPFNDGGKEYINRLMAVKEGLGVGENYAVIAFGEAASFCLDYYLKPNNVSRLCALIAYYPTCIPDPRSRFPASLRVMTHLAGETVGVTITPTMLGLQGKKRLENRRIDPGMGTGERVDIGHQAYTYENMQLGFAEHDVEEFNQLAANLAWTRSLQMLRKAFGREVDLEKPWEEHLEGKFFSLDISQTMEPYGHTPKPHVTYTPTLSGGVGERALRRFYEHHFLRSLPPSMSLRLLSRTIGADRVVDELFISFEHTQEIPWLLPGVPATNRKVEFILVSIVSLRNGKLHSEHVYWDQASVLVQTGLLDPKLVPTGVKGVDTLPVVGSDAARRILNEGSEAEGREYHNQLIHQTRPRQNRSKEPRKDRADAPSVKNQSGDENGNDKGKTHPPYQPSAETALEDGTS